MCETVRQARRQLAQRPIGQRIFVVEENQRRSLGKSIYGGVKERRYRFGQRTALDHTHPLLPPTNNLLAHQDSPLKPLSPSMNVGHVNCQTALEWAPQRLPLSPDAAEDGRSARYEERCLITRGQSRGEKTVHR